MKVRNEIQYQKKKDEILEIYYLLVGENGFKNVTLVNIATRLEINPSLVLHYFKNKRQMTLEFVDYVLEKCTDNPYIRPEVEANEYKRVFLDYIDYLFIQDLDPNLMETKVFFDCHSLALRDAEVWKKFKAHHDRVIELVKKELDFFVKKGAIPEIDTRLASVFIFSVTSGLADYRDFSEDIEDFNRVLINQKQAVISYILSQEK